MGYAQLEYCLTSEDKIKLDFLDLFFVGIVVSLIAITITSSYYDKNLQKTRATPDEQKAHYKLSVAGSSECILRFQFSPVPHHFLLFSSKLPRVFLLSPQLASSDNDPQERH